MTSNGPWLHPRLAEADEGFELTENPVGLCTDGRHLKWSLRHHRLATQGADDEVIVADGKFMGITILATVSNLNHGKISWGLLAGMQIGGRSQGRRSQPH
jgi:hypothetical protein